MNHNEETLKTYNSPGAAETYEANTAQVVSGFVGEWLEYFCKLLQKGGKILELGSGTGRDAKFFQQKGFSVQTTDASQAFLEMLHKKGFDNAILLNVITDVLPGGYNAYFANGVLLHITRNEMRQVLNKVWEVLPDGGFFAFSVKWGEGEEVVTDKLARQRYFCYWNISEDIEENLLVQLQAMRWKIVDIRTQTLKESKGQQIGWIYFILQKEG